MSAGEADLPSEQQSHYGEEYGENKQHVGGAHHRVVGELVASSSNLIDVEAHREDEGSRAEEDHWKKDRR